jgi:hypothetical protein
MGGPMLLESVTQTRTQKTQNTAKHSGGAGLFVCDLCSVLCDRPDMDGGRGLPEESLPPVLVAPSHTELFIRALCSVVLRIGAGLRGGVGHTCVLHNSTVIREEDADPGKRGRQGLWPEGRSHAVRWQVSRNHEGLGLLGRAGQRRMDRTFWDGNTILSPVMQGRLLRPCLPLLVGPALPLHFSPTTRPQTAPFLAGR